jgi:DNA-binding transcriptional MerR regulator
MGLFVFMVTAPRRSTPPSYAVPVTPAKARPGATTRTGTTPGPPAGERSGSGVAERDRSSTTAGTARHTGSGTAEHTDSGTAEQSARRTAGLPEELLSIGVFARRSRLSLKALRLYDRLGLLIPAAVDPSNGYRRYQESQLFTARLIVLLRQLDMPLSTVREILSAPGAAGAELLTAYWNAVEHRIAGQRDLAQLLRISLLGGDARFDGYDVRERDVPHQRVLTELKHLRLDELEGWVRASKDRLSTIAREAGGVAGPLFIIFHGAVNDDSDGPVEVCVPLGHDRKPPAGGPAVREEPAHREAYVRVTKAQFEMPQILSAYDAVERWLSARKAVCMGSPREVHIPGVDITAAAQTDDVCDVAFPF